MKFISLSSALRHLQMRLMMSVLLCSLLFNGISHANVLGDMQTFAPNSDGLDFITVHTARPLYKGWFALGGHLSFAKNHMVVFKELETQERYRYKDELAEFDLDVAYGLTENFSVFFAAPNLIYQESEKGQVVDVVASKGVHSYRPGFKWSLGESIWDLALVASVDILNVTNSPYTGEGRSPIYNVELAKTFALEHKITYGLNVGYRMRTPGTIPVDANMFPLDDQITFSVGRSAPLFGKSRWVLEGFFSVPTDKSPYKKTKDASSADILLGFKHRILRNLNLDWGGTIEPGIDTQSPQYRAFIGLVYYFSPGWSSSPDVKSTPPPAAAPIPGDTAGEEEIEAEVDQQVLHEGTEPLNVIPQQAEIFTGEVFHFQVTGGAAPYSYRLIQGRGRFNGPSGTYRAPLREETAQIEVKDRKADVRIIEILVREPSKPSETIRLKNLNFVFNTDVLVPASQKEIDRIIGLFQGKRVSRIIVEGHTDSKGSNEYNLELSEKRAQAVRRIFIRSLGLTETQVTAIGYGEERPIKSNATEAGRLMNRRVDLKIYYNK